MRFDKMGHKTDCTCFGCRGMARIIAELDLNHRTLLAMGDVIQSGVEALVCHVVVPDIRARNNLEQRLHDNVTELRRAAGVM